MPSLVSEAELCSRLRDYIAEFLQTSPDEVDLDANFDQLGIDSAAGVDLAMQMEEWVGIEVDPVWPYEHSSIRRLVKHVCRQVDPVDSNVESDSAVSSSNANAESTEDH